MAVAERKSNGDTTKEGFERLLARNERCMRDYLDRELYLPELALLRRFKGQWGQMDMLDVGVGAGRTAYTFAAISRRYVGIDYLENMILLCKDLVGEDDSTRFATCDARVMSDAIAERFDLVLFSFNGLDMADHDDRLTILQQARNMLKDGGHFFFSSHSLRAFPFEAPRPETFLRRPLLSSYRLGIWAYQSARLRRLNARMSTSDLAQTGWTRVPEYSLKFKVDLYHVFPEFQVEQLRQAGFALVDIYNLQGKCVDPRDPGKDGFLYYLCRRIP
ncbi:MAG: class I SAM-dependent methyltransferase [Actinomycetota bacterium]|nr:class I SAM-dependent methyltransferase [Actinomycetota bacterium]